MRTWQYIATAQDDQMRLSHLLHLRMKLTRKQISRLKFTENGILINQRPARTDQIVRTGDQILLNIVQRDLPDEHLPMQISLKILYDTPDFIAVHKPSNLTFHPSPGHYYDTLSIQLSHLLQQRGDTFKLFAIGRLDKDTSGIALFAKHTIAAQRLQKQRENHILQKEYLALVHGITPKQGILTAPIRKKENELNRMEVHLKGKYAYTYYERIRTNEQVSLLRIQLKSGRTHQIRVHMQSIDHAIVGDPFYGIHDGISRLCLHAHKLSFLDPFSDTPIVISDNDTSFDDIIKQQFNQYTK